MDGELAGVGIGWRCFEDDLDRDWAKWRDRGDCFYFSHLVCKGREAIPPLVEELYERCSDWERLKLLARRNGKRREYSPRFIERLIRNEQALVT